MIFIDHVRDFIESFKRVPESGINISEHNFKQLLAARNDFGAALQRLADLSEALARKDDADVPEHLRNVTEGDLASAVADARALLNKYGEYAGFVFG